MQNPTKRPSFAEIIQVLRRLQADEARRVASKLPGDAAAARSQQGPTLISSAVTARLDQVILQRHAWSLRKNGFLTFS